MIKRLHVEATSKCTLKCSKCERTVLFNRAKSLLHITDLDIDKLINFIDMPIECIEFGGNLGDPIYHSNFHELIKAVKKKVNSVVIITNGSYKSTTWWKSLCELLDENDQIWFSIDGTPENFTNYRVNADWASIKQGIEICVKSKVTTVWKYLVFDYNENNIDYCRQLSKEIGFDLFKVELSERYTESDAKPSEQYIKDKYQVQKQLKTDNAEVEIIPACANNNQHYISASGYYTPCCYVSHHSYYYKSVWWKQKNNFDITTNRLSSCINKLDDFLKTIQSEKPYYCKFHCGKIK